MRVGSSIWSSLAGRVLLLGAAAGGDGTTRS